MRTDSEIFIINPYIAGSPVKNPTMFFGRDDVYAWLRQHLRGRYQDNVIVLYGERRSGKTSVLYQMSEHLGDDTYLPVLIDLQGMGLESIDGFLWEITRKIVLGLRGVEGVPLLDRPSRRDFEDNPLHEFEEVFLPPIIAALGARRLLLMFDETNRLDEKIESGELTPEVIGYLRSLMQHSNHINFIFSVGSRVQDSHRKTSELFNLAVYRKISFLDQDFAEDLISKPVRQHYTYTRPAIDLILRLTSGQPYYTQLLCHNLFTRWTEYKPKQLDIADIKAVLPDVVEQATPNLQFSWDDSTPEEKVILAALAAKMPQYQAGVLRRNLDRALPKAKLYPPGRDVTNGLKRLFERDILNNQEPYEFRVELLRLWLAEFKQLEWVREELKEVANEWEAREQKRRSEAPTPVEQARQWAMPVLAGILIGLLLALIVVWQNLSSPPPAAPGALVTEVTQLETKIAIAETEVVEAESEGNPEAVQQARATAQAAIADAATVQARVTEAIQTEGTAIAAEIEAAKLATAAAEAQATATAGKQELAALENITATPTETSTPLPPTPTSTATTTPTPVPHPQGRLAIPVDNRGGSYNVNIYALPAGQLLQEISNARQPSFNKVDGRLAVRARRGDDEAIWIYDSAGVNGHQVSPTLSLNSHPAWGPNGLVYENQSVPKDGRTVWRIFVQNIVSQSTPDKVSLLAGDIFDADRPLYPLWSDDDEIIFSACNYWIGGGQCGIWRTAAKATIDKEGFRFPQNITSQGEIPTDVHGDRLLIMGKDGNSWEVYLTSTEGESLKNLSNHPANDGLATFSPDGRWVAFVSNRGNAWAVWVVPLSGGEATRLPIEGLRFATGERDWTTERISWAP